MRTAATAERTAAAAAGYRRMRALILLPLVCACSAEQPLAPEKEGGTAAPVAEAAPPQSDEALPPPPPPPPAAPSLPGLLPLGEAQVTAALGTGASCTLTEDGPPLMVAVPGRAVVNDGGRMVLLATEAMRWSDLREGGVFKGDRVVIEVDAGHEMQRDEETVERDSTVSIRRGRRGFTVSHGPRWICGA